jgi:pimeloyl-ACP methyl ester carboxylesterase
MDWKVVYEDLVQQAERLRPMVPQLLVGQTAGSGHFIQLEVPDQVNAMIERFLTLNELSHRG